MTDLDGKVALVTGAGSGIGRASAAALAAAGARVIVSDISDEGGKETVSAINSAGGKASYVHADVSNRKDAEALVPAAVELYGRLDCAHNNAGITIVAELADTTDEQWDRILAVNLTSVFTCMRSQIKHMLANGGGSIVNTASSLGLVGQVVQGAYCASKHGIIGITRAAALDYATRRIRVNAIAPGLVRTALTEGMGAETVAQMATAQPMMRLGEPQEIAAAVTWLCSDAAAFVTGTVLAVDGGYLAR